jgi:hypothetical protein
MAIDKKMNYEIQGGVKNYRPSKMVTVPKIAKSSPDTPTAKLAYITPEEEKILIDLNLYGSLKGKPNRGPGGIPSLEGDFGGSGGFGGFQGGGDYSSAETGNFSGFDGTGSGPELPPGVDRKPSQEAQDIRSAAIAAGAGQRVNPGFFDSRNTVSPAELARAKAFAPQAYKTNRSRGVMDFITGGGIMGGLIRGLGQKFGLGKTYDQPTYDMSGYSSLGLGGSNQPGFGVPNFESGDGDYDMLGNKINEITGEIISPTGASLGFLEGYPGQKTGIETIVPVTGGSSDYTKLVEQFLPKSTMPEDDELLGSFTSRYLSNRTKEEKKAIEDMINEKFKYDYNSFGLEDMDGS